MTAPRPTVDDLVREARAGLRRLTAVQAHTAMQAGALLLDIRGDHQRERDGIIPGAHFIPRNVFEWRCDPSSEWRDPTVTEPPGRWLIVICDEGYQSSLAAATLVRFGFEDAGDVIDGFQAWRQAGLPVLPAAVAAAL
jgi:rhodanese-related sulfurtransferase